MRPSAPTCSRCGGALDTPLPPELLDPRLNADRLIMRCSGCGRAERVDLPQSWRSR